MAKLTPDSAVRPPKRFVMPEISSIGVVMLWSVQSSAVRGESLGRIPIAMRWGSCLGALAAAEALRDARNLKYWRSHALVSSEFGGPRRIAWAHPHRDAMGLLLGSSRRRRSAS